MQELRLEKRYHRTIHHQEYSSLPQEHFLNLAIS